MRALSATISLGLLLTVGVGGAAADSQCVQDAKEQRGQCRTACDEDFVISRDLCRNIDPECAAGCRVALDDCRAPIVSALEHCVDGCRERLNAERAACPRRGRGHDFCIDRAQIRAFLCRDDCRESLHVRDGLNACRQGFTTCMTGCGIPAEPTPTPTKTPVKTEAPPQPTAVKTEPPPQPTAVRTEPPPEPTAVRTEPPPEPTAVRTEPPPEPTATPTELPPPDPTSTPTRTATPRPTSTFSGPR